MKTSYTLLKKPRILLATIAAFALLTTGLGVPNNANATNKAPAAYINSEPAISAAFDPSPPARVVQNWNQVHVLAIPAAGNVLYYYVSNPTPTNAQFAAYLDQGTNAPSDKKPGTTLNEIITSIGGEYNIGPIHDHAGGALIN